MAHFMPMDKNTPALALECDLPARKATRITHLIHPEHAPLGMADKCETVSKPGLLDTNPNAAKRRIQAVAGRVRKNAETLGMLVGRCST